MLRREGELEVKNQVGNDDAVAQAKAAWHNLLNGMHGIAKERGGQQKKVFISYAWPRDPSETAELQSWLKQLKHDLNMAGIEVFLDVQNMSGNLEKTMLDNLTASDFIIPILTPRFLERARDPNTNLAFEFKETLKKAQANPAAVLPILREGGFQDVVKDELAILSKQMIYTIQANVNVDPFLVNLSDPLGLIPVIYGFKNDGQDKYQQAYQDLLTAWLSSDLNRLPSLLPDPIERSSAFQQLVDGFKQQAVTNGKIQPIQIIQGIGGVGKTQLAISYAHQYHADRKGFVCWVNADKVNLPSEWSRLGIALRLDLKGLSAARQKQEIRTALSKEENWLIILDNLQDQDALEGLLPQKQLPTQQVLITSRSLNWGRYPVYNLTPFTVEESQTYFETRILKKPLRDGSDALAVTLGHLPLALSHATAYMNEKRMTAKAYHKLYKQKGVALLAKSIKDEASEANYAFTALSTYQSSIDQLTEKNPRAAELLKFCAYLHPEHIKKRFLQPLLKMDDEVYADCVGHIASYGLLIEGEDGSSRHMHCLVQAAIRHSQAEDDVFTKRLKPMAETIIALQEKTKDPEKRRILQLHVETLISHVQPFAEVENASPDHVNCLAQLKEALGEKERADAEAKEVAQAEQAEKIKAQAEQMETVTSEETEKRRAAEERKDDEDKTEGRVKTYSPIWQIAYGRFWKPPVQTPPQVAQFLRLVAEGEQDQAEAMLKANPNLALQSGTVTDLSKRTFEHITAFQYAVWARDWHMWTMLLKYLPQEEAALQLHALETNGTEHGTYFDFGILIGAYAILEQNWSKWNSNQCNTHWVKQIGGAQLLVPAHVANEYSRRDRPLYPLPDFTQGTLPRARGIQKTDWYAQELGNEWTWGRGRESRPSFFSKIPTLLATALYMTIHIPEQRAMQSLCITREQQLQMLKAELYRNRQHLRAPVA